MTYLALTDGLCEPNCGEGLTLALKLFLFGSLTVITLIVIVIVVLRGASKTQRREQQEREQEAIQNTPAPASWRFPDTSTNGEQQKNKADDNKLT